MALRDDTLEAQLADGGEERAAVVERLLRRPRTTVERELLELLSPVDVRTSRRSTPSHRKMSKATNVIGTEASGLSTRRQDRAGSRARPRARRRVRRRGRDPRARHGVQGGRASCSTCGGCELRAHPPSRRSRGIHPISSRTTNPNPTAEARTRQHRIRQPQGSKRYWQLRRVGWGQARQPLRRPSKTLAPVTGVQADPPVAAPNVPIHPYH